MSKEKVLFFDIETSPIITKEHKWGIWDDRAIEQEVIQDWQILSIGWRFKGGGKISVIGQDDYPDYVPGKLNDKKLLEAFWPVIADADVIVAHNGDRFDMRKLRARMIQQGLPPLPPAKQYDTMKAFKRIGAFTSNRLKDLSRVTGGSAKGDPGGFKTWKGCMAGEAKYWKHMKKYNKLDIPPLEDLYNTVTPWDKQSPALNILAGELDACPNCLGKNVKPRGLTAPTKTGQRRRYRCADCGKWLQGRGSVRSDVKYTA